MCTPRGVPRPPGVVPLQCCSGEEACAVQSPGRLCLSLPPAGLGCGQGRMLPGCVLVLLKYCHVCFRPFTLSEAFLDGSPESQPCPARLLQAWPCYCPSCPCFSGFSLSALQRCVAAAFLVLPPGSEALVEPSFKLLSLECLSLLKVSHHSLLLVRFCPGFVPDSKCLSGFDSVYSGDVSLPPLRASWPACPLPVQRVSFPALHRSPAGTLRASSLQSASLCSGFLVQRRPLLSVFMAQGQ